jgi:ferritin-like metal-binding protein YciE
MSTAATLTQYRIDGNLRLLAGAEQTARNYRKLLALATELGEQYEIERLSRTLNEVEADADELRDKLLHLGYTPE